jgi:hypothetical protein
MNTQRRWFRSAKAALSACIIWLSCPLVYAEPPRNIIFFIGDGMGFEQVQAAQAYTGSVMSFNNPALFPWRADCTTYSASSSVTDSAADGTTDILWRNVTTGAYLGTLVDDLTRTRNFGGSTATLQVTRP